MLAAKSELQGVLYELIGQEVSVRLREQLLSQEMWQQNDMLSREVEEQSNDVCKEKVTIVGKLEEKVTLRDHKVCLLGAYAVHVPLCTLSLSLSLSLHFLIST